MKEKPVCYFCGGHADRRKICPDREATARFPNGKKHVTREGYLGRPMT